MNSADFDVKRKAIDVTILARLALASITAGDAPPHNAMERVRMELEASLRDASSIKDITLCQPHRLPSNNGWGVHMEFNATNGFGAYGGLQTYLITLLDEGSSRLIHLGHVPAHVAIPEGREPMRSTQFKIELRQKLNGCEKVTLEEFSALP